MRCRATVSCASLFAAVRSWWARCCIVPSGLRWLPPSLHAAALSQLVLIAGRHRGDRRPSRRSTSREERRSQSNRSGGHSGRPRKKAARQATPTPTITQAAHSDSTKDTHTIEEAESEATKKQRKETVPTKRPFQPNLFSADCDTNIHHLRLLLDSHVGKCYARFIMLLHLSQRLS